MQSSLVAVLLAAGESKRLGFPKQLCMWNGRSLLERSIAALRARPIEQVYVVSGAAREACSEILRQQNPPVIEIFNPDFSAGMGSSIACAARYLLAHNVAAAALFCVCDQLRVDASVIATLLTTASDERGNWYLTASRYGDTLGVPAIFPQPSWKELTQLKGEKGAKSLLQANPDLRIFPFPGGDVDLDTPSDLLEHGVQKPPGF